MKKLLAGIDIGGTKIAVALAEIGGAVLSKRAFPTQLKADAHQTFGCVLDELASLIERENAELAAIGIACVGPLDTRRGTILAPPNLPGWSNFPLVEITGRRFNVPVALDNDANAAALAEHRFGAGRGFDNLIYLTISTGVGGGIIIDGWLVRGLSGNAGEIGHIKLIPDGEKCGCGARGCLETICSGTAIARRARARIFGGAASLMTQKIDDLQQISAKTVIEAARENDFLATEILQETTSYLSLAVGNLVITLEPEAVILGGSVASAAGEMLLAPLREQVYERVKMFDAKKTQILAAGLASESSVYGALALADDILKTSEKSC